MIVHWTPIEIPMTAHRNSLIAHKIPVGGLWDAYGMPMEIYPFNASKK